MPCRSCEEARRRAREAVNAAIDGRYRDARHAASQSVAAATRKITDEAARVRSLLTR